jgi:cyclic pyranopterin monophosphate synthase
MGADRNKKRVDELTHLDEKGHAKMVDVSHKRITARTAMAEAGIIMEKNTLDLILGAGIEKGDVLDTARIAGIMAAKKTSDIIPMCHPIAVTSVEMDFEVDRKRSSITAVATARTRDRTGVEMEALTAAAVAALTIYDMCKAIDRSMTITSVRLLKKSGGRSGTFVREKE